jgi:two-component system phosphate regulon sensor histidine kinase PhoR
LEQVIDNKLSARGIYTEYKYGVFSSSRNSFVIKNGNYQVDNFGPQVVAHEYSDSELLLINSRYKIPLYPSGIKTPGYLYMYFPSLNSFVLNSIWKTLIAALLFTGAILFCFVYTVLVVFRQKKVSEMKTDFINNMTHEFKTPIATISLAADSIKSPVINSNPDKVVRFANIIKQENKRMLEQVEKVLQMAKFDRENLNLQLTQVDIHDVITQAVNNISLQVNQKEGTVEAILDAGKHIIEADENHISNIIHNLLDNANKYTPEKPNIKIFSKEKSDGIEVTVQDNGIGLSKEAQKHIFEKFYRVHTGNLHDVKGFGLGLSYVKALVTAHSGMVSVKSDLGKGSRFILKFPFTQPK